MIHIINMESKEHKNFIDINKSNNMSNNYKNMSNTNNNMGNTYNNMSNTCKNDKISRKYYKHKTSNSNSNK
jgi:hypothetical protein